MKRILLIGLSLVFLFSGCQPAVAETQLDKELRAIEELFENASLEDDFSEVYNVEITTTPTPMVQFHISPELEFYENFYSADEYDQVRYNAAMQEWLNSDKSMYFSNGYFMFAKVPHLDSSSETLIWFFLTDSISSLDENEQKSTPFFNLDVQEFDRLTIYLSDLETHFWVLGWHRTSRRQRWAILEDESGNRAFVPALIQEPNTFCGV